MIASIGSVVAPTRRKMPVAPVMVLANDHRAARLHQLVKLGVNPAAASHKEPDAQSEGPALRLRQERAKETACSSRGRT